jgi:hypothetical protein
MKLAKFCALIFVSALAFGPVTQAATPERSGEWFQKSLVGMEVGPTGAQFSHSDTNDARYCARLAGTEIVKRCLRANCQYVVMWARDGDYAYYDSKLLIKAPGLGTRDPLREAVVEAHRHKIPLIAYCVVQQNGHFLDAHPELAMRNAEGKRIDRFCYNSGYLEFMKQIVNEQITYGIDGFHIDMVDQGFGPPYGCWCDSCRKEFEMLYGRAMPKGVTWDENWDRMLEFRYRTSEKFEKALYTHIKRAKPELSVDFNYHGNPPFSWEVGQRPVQHAGNSDFVTGETGMWGFSALTVGLNAEFYRAATPGLPVQVAISRDARVYHNQTVRPLADLRWELSTLLAHGSFVTVVDKLGFDGSLDPLAYERVGQSFADALTRKKHFGQQPVADVGIYFSSRTRDWCGRDQAPEHYLRFQGAHKALVYEHIPWGVVLDENAGAETLKRFPIVLLPNVSIVSDKEVDLLKQYVTQGGCLIVTGTSGCCDKYGKLLDHSDLEPLTGTRLIRTLDSLDNWVRFPGSHHSRLARQFAPEGRSDWSFLVKGPAIVAEPTTAISVGELLKPWRTTRQQRGQETLEWPMSAEAVVGPALFVNQVGKGKVITFACSPDYATASEHHIVEARHLISDAVHYLLPHPRLRITAPATVESVVTDDPPSRTLRVHLIGYNTPPQTMPARNRPYVLPALIEDSPIYRARIEFDGPMKSASVVNKSTSLKRRGPAIEVTVEDVHEVVVLKY